MLRIIAVLSLAMLSVALAYWPRTGLPGATAPGAEPATTAATEPQARETEARLKTSTLQQLLQAGGQARLLDQAGRVIGSLDRSGLPQLLSGFTLAQVTQVQVVGTDGKSALYTLQTGQDLLTLSLGSSE